MNWHLGEGFCKCCQPQIHWYDMHKSGWNVLHSDERTQWTVQWCSSAQMATPFACSFNIVYISIRLLSSFFIWHCMHPHFLSLSVHMSLSLSFCGTPGHPLFLISGLSLRFGDVQCFLLAIQSSFALRVETVAPSGDHYCIDLVVASSDHCALRQCCHLVIITELRNYRHLVITYTLKERSNVN